MEIAAVGRRRRAGGRLDLGPASIAAVGRRGRAGGRLGPASGSRRGPAGAGRRTTRARFWQPYGLSFVFYSFKSDLNLFRACMFTESRPASASPSRPVSAPYPDPPPPRNPGPTPPRI